MVVGAGRAFAAGMGYMPVAFAGQAAAGVIAGTSAAEAAAVVAAAIAGADAPVVRRSRSSQKEPTAGLSALEQAEGPSTGRYRAGIRLPLVARAVARLVQPSKPSSPVPGQVVALAGVEAGAVGRTVSARKDFCSWRCARSPFVVYY